MRKFYIAYLMTMITLLGLTLTVPAHGAGSGGGGMGSGTYSENRRALTPEQKSAKAFRAGIKYRDRALAQERKAEKAKTPKSAERALAKARKHYLKAKEHQGEAIKLDPRNYKAANELGFALRKVGDYRKAIGAYNYALNINPKFHEATEYRAEAFLALGMLDQTRQSYMVLFREDRGLAQQLMERIDAWIVEQGEPSNEAHKTFIAWVDERKRIASITKDLSMNNTRSW